MLHKLGALHLPLISTPKPGTHSSQDPHTFSLPWKDWELLPRNLGNPVGHSQVGIFNLAKIRFCHLFPGRLTHEEELSSHSARAVQQLSGDSALLHFQRQCSESKE